jgi:hypothetical protein
VEPRLSVGQPSSDEVADRQGNHDNADDICPDKGGRSEKWRHEPRRAKLNGHDTHTGEKSEHINIKWRHVHFTQSSLAPGYFFLLHIPFEASGNPPGPIFKTNRPYRYFQVASINYHPGSKDQKLMTSLRRFLFINSSLRIRHSEIGRLREILQVGE